MLTRAKILLAFILFCFLYFFYGFYVFVNVTIPYHIKNYSSCNVEESIAVLTGGSHRIMEGINLYSKNITKPILISGVNGAGAYNNIRKIFELRNIDLSNLMIGYHAQNTRENIIEIKTFMAINRLNHVTVVTSYYHLPRVYFELKRASVCKFTFCTPLSGKDASFGTLFLEYVKLLLSTVDVITLNWIDNYNKTLSYFLKMLHNK
ncbi:YdcF family protein [Candidatus Cyrtobacter comes]|uniref:YdcF family protein n=1 Tax=Candidatus Cyrtobacter comes TaxID=675776 RepID=A0ABU5L8X2_9RICK|nr:YdcF family protein [Candidatus Cyrtobacter comes]MDZ5762573.1 YdcF family protein [Candidatus Cyrtobacter comes]